MLELLLGAIAYDDVKEDLHEIKSTQALRIERLETALTNIRKRCFDGSELAVYIDKVLKC